MNRNPHLPTRREKFGFMCWHGYAYQMLSAHIHMEVEANLIKSGSYSYLFGGQRVDIRAGELAIFWGSIPHQSIDAAPDSEILWFTLPLSCFLGWDLPGTLVSDLLHGKVVKEKVDVQREELQFADWEKDLKSGDLARLRIVELEMQARLRRLVLNMGSEPRDLTESVQESSIQCTSAGEIGHIEKMASFMVQNYRESISIDDIARAASIHPNYAMNLFKSGFGLSLGHFLTHARLSQVQRLLVTTDRTVLDIAFSSGFGSASHFHAIFKKHCGQSPASYRNSLRRKN